MKKTAQLLCLLSAAAISSWAACPADPVSVIQSSKWAFQLTSGDYAVAGSAVVGTFQALPAGMLTVTETWSSDNVTNRLQTASGRYIVYGDCTGGELMFMVNGLAIQLEFVYTRNFTEMRLVSDQLNSRYRVGTVLTGYAKRTTTGCPAGLGDPLNILNNTTWSLRTFPAYNAGGPGSSSVGLFSPVNVGGSGRLSGNETISYGPLGPIVRQAQISGRYIIYPDCSGGEIMIMNRGNPIPSLQLEFVFAGPNFDEMYMLNDSLYGGPTPIMITRAPVTQADQFFASWAVVAGTATKF